MPGVELLGAVVEVLPVLGVAAGGLVVVPGVAAPVVAGGLLDPAVVVLPALGVVLAVLAEVPGAVAGLVVVVVVVGVPVLGDAAGAGAVVLAGVVGATAGPVVVAVPVVLGRAGGAFGAVVDTGLAGPAVVVGGVTVGEAVGVATGIRVVAGVEPVVIVVARCEGALGARRAATGGKDDGSPWLGRTAPVPTVAIAAATRIFPITPVAAPIPPTPAEAA